MELYKNWGPLLATAVPVTNNAGTAPRVIVAELDVYMFPDDVLTIFSKIQNRVLAKYTTGVSGLVQVEEPDSVNCYVTRAMGWNANVDNIKYVISHGTGFFQATKEGVHKVQHVIWAYSSAAPMPPNTQHTIDVMYVDQQVMKQEV